MVLLGSTGSIGVSAIIIAKKFNIDIEVLVAGKNIKLLNKQIKEINPKIVVIQNKEDIPKINHSNILFGEDGIIEALNRAKSDLVVNALVGFAGLKPTLETLRLKKELALANKESLVVAGAFIDTSKITPIDSEHFGLWYVLDKQKPVERMQITASGGAFRDWDINKIANAKLEDALKHPNWSMGTKITIDSATMINKLFELLEARWLFPNVNKFDAFIETKSIIHAVVDYVDGSSVAHIAKANMQLPIAYAITKKVDTPILEKVDFINLANLEFKKITKERYPIWEIKDYLLENPKVGLILNAANEVAIDGFVKDKITFSQISTLAIKAIEYFNNLSNISNIDDIFEKDKQVRNFCKELIL